MPWDYQLESVSPQVLEVPLVQSQEYINARLHGTFDDDCIVDLSAGNAKSRRFAQQRFAGPC